MSPKKQKKRGGEKAKRKSQHCCVTFKAKPKFCVQRMPERRGVNIIMKQKAVKCTTCKRLCGKFQLFTSFTTLQFQLSFDTLRNCQIWGASCFFFLLFQQVMKCNLETYFPKFSCTCVLRFSVNYRISSFEQMN